MAPCESDASACHGYMIHDFGIPPAADVDSRSWYGMYNHAMFGSRK